MRVVTVHPGPAWSVADCHNGYTEALRQLGVTVIEYDTGARLEFFEQARFDDAEAGIVEAIPDEQDRAVLVSKGLESVLYEVWPDIVWVTYGPCVDPRTLQLARERGHIVVMHHTESPYEDERGLRWAAAGVADLWLINDPANLEQWRRAWPHVTYLPHSYRPALHRPATKPTPARWDVIWCGSSFPSRVEWFERFVAEAGDLDLALAGNWMALPDGHKLAPHLLNGNRESLDNDEVPPLYHQARLGLNMYRREAEQGATADGWAMGPREIEMAACGLFHLTEPRGENRAVLPMLPTFDSPEDAAEQARWWTAHPAARDKTARQARAAIADWTFANRARQILDLIERLNVS